MKLFYGLELVHPGRVLVHLGAHEFYIYKFVFVNDHFSSICDDREQTLR